MQVELTDGRKNVREGIEARSEVSYRDASLHLNIGDEKLLLDDIYNLSDDVRRVNPLHPTWRWFCQGIRL